MSEWRSYSVVDSFDTSNDEFTKVEYREIEREARKAQKLDAPLSLEPMEQTLMRMILIARKNLRG